MKITLLEWPTEADWLKVKQRALVTVGKTQYINPPDAEWRDRILRGMWFDVKKAGFAKLYTSLLRESLHLT